MYDYCFILSTLTISNMTQNCGLTYATCWKNLNYHIRPDGPIRHLASGSGCRQACWHLGQVRSGPVRMLAFGSGSSQLLGIPISQLASGSGLLVFGSGCCQPFGILISQLASIVRVRSAP